MPPKLNDCGLGRGAQPAADNAARRPWRSLALPRSQCISPPVTLRLPDEARNVGGGRYTTLRRPLLRQTQAPIAHIREGPPKRRPAQESAAAMQETL